MTTTAVRPPKELREIEEAGRRYIAALRRLRASEHVIEAAKEGVEREKERAVSSSAESD